MRKLKSQKETQEIPFIIMTGVRLDSHDLSLALEDGAFDFLRKPLEALEVKARIRNALKIVENKKREIQQLENLSVGTEYLHHSVHQPEGTNG